MNFVCQTNRSFMRLKFSQYYKVRIGINIGSIVQSAVRILLINVRAVVFPRVSAYYISVIKKGTKRRRPRNRRTTKQS